MVAIMTRRHVATTSLALAASLALVPGLVGLVGCKKPPPQDTPSASAASAAPATATGAPAATPAAVDPFQWGYCELSIDGAPPTRHPGGGYKVASRHWAAPGPQRDRVEPLILNCGKVNLSTATIAEADYPMRAGKHAVAPGSTKPGTFVAVPGGKGELVIDAWDKSGIQGSFKLTGFDGGKTATGKFDFKCPPTLACK